MRISRSAEGWQDRLLFAVYACAAGLEACAPRTRRALHRRALAWRRSVYGQGTGVIRVIGMGDHIRLKVDISERIGGDLFFGVEFEPMEVQLLAGLIAPNDVVVDVGANIGVHAMLCARRVGPEGCVHAFEPGRRPYGMLCANIELNGLGNVIANKCALGDEPRTASLLVNSESSLSSLGRTGRGEIVATESVEMTTLDAYCSERKIERLDFLKVDVEGFEGHVLRGARGILTRSADVGVLCELAEKNFAPLGLSVSEVIKTVRGLGFDIWELDETRNAVLRLPPDITATRAQNFLFIRPAGQKEDRLRRLLDSAGHLVRGAHDGV